MSLRTRLMTLAGGLLGLVSLATAAPAATAAAAPVQGTDYRLVVPPQNTLSPDKIEVVEFFSYACPHCGAFFPVVNQWLARQPKDVVFRRVPIGFSRPEWINLARAYYALQSTGDLPRLDGALLHAIHGSTSACSTRSHWPTGSPRTVATATVRPPTAPSINNRRCGRTDGRGLRRRQRADARRRREVRRDGGCRSGERSSGGTCSRTRPDRQARAQHAAAPPRQGQGQEVALLGRVQRGSSAARCPRHALAAVKWIAPRCRRAGR